ncbi:MAG: PorV/PorQ family protein [bacterium]|nr:PorV/PorQ family protein [bacterium]
MKKFITSSWIIVLLSLPVASFGFRIGGCAAPFLTIGGGTRALALGGAYSAFAEGTEAIYWNPAGIAKLHNIGADFVYANLFPGSGISVNNIAITVPAGDGTIGVSAVSLLSGDMLYQPDIVETSIPVYFSANSFAIGVSYARRMTDKFNSGVTFKIVNQYAYNTSVSAPGWACDVGGTYNTKINTLKLGFVNFSDLRFGFMIQNFGPDIAFSGQRLRFYYTYDDTMQSSDIPAIWLPTKDPLPLSFQFGIAVNTLNTKDYKITLMSDLVNVLDQPTTFGFGMEASMSNKYFARVGYTGKNNIWDGNTEETLIGRVIERFKEGYTVGFGIINKVAGTRDITVDYTYQSHKYLNGIHRMGVGFSL